MRKTHNFPTAIAPFEGAATGIGGRIRDSQSTGKGSLPIASVAGYCVGDINNFDVPNNICNPITILIEASNGASDYGNKFGEPIICGFTRSYGRNTIEQKNAKPKMVNKIPDNDENNTTQHIEWLKPIMFTAGIGFIDQEHLYKNEPEKGMLIAKIGGPAYRIGVGGGAASSRVSDKDTADLDFNAVQRGDAEMGQKVNRVIRACIEVGDKNPILSIHDQGAGGNGNVLKEIIDGKGGNIDIGKITLGDHTLNDIEIWLAEYQESNAVLVSKDSIEIMQGICDREAVNFDIVGEITGDGLINITNGYREIISDYKHDDKSEPKTYYLQKKELGYESSENSESSESSESSENNKIFKSETDNWLCKDNNSDKVI